MAWFKKQPGEKSTLTSYWQATDTVSRPTAIILTLIIMFICLAVVFSLFLGGRWLYSSINGKNKTTTSETNNDDNKGITQLGAASSTTANGSSQAIGTKTTPTPTPKPSATPAPATASSANNPLPNTGPSELPNTGPGPE